MINMTRIAASAYGLLAMTVFLNIFLGYTRNDIPLRIKSQNVNSKITNQNSKRFSAAGGQHEVHLELRSPVKDVRDALWQDVVNKNSTEPQAAQSRRVRIMVGQAPTLQRITAWAKAHHTPDSAGG